MKLTSRHCLLSCLIISSTVFAQALPTSNKSPQTITINNGSEVASLDPHKVEGVPEGNIILNLLEGLVYEDIEGKAVPGMASSWQNENYTVWTFTIRDDAKWSDGTPVVAEDFVYSWQRLADPKTDHLIPVIYKCLYRKLRSDFKRAETERIIGC